MGPSRRPRSATRPRSGSAWRPKGSSSATGARIRIGACGRRRWRADGRAPHHAGALSSGCPAVAPLARLGLVVHPSRDLEPALTVLRRWAQEHGVELVQLRAHEDQRQVVPPGAVEDADLVVAVGGDGTVLGALRMGARAGKAVLGVACGSLGTLAAVPPGGVAAALD